MGTEIQKMVIVAEGKTGQAYLINLTEFEKDFILSLLHKDNEIKGMKIEPVTFKPIRNEQPK